MNGGGKLNNKNNIICVCMQIYICACYNTNYIPKEVQKETLSQEKHMRKQKESRGNHELEAASCLLTLSSPTDMRSLHCQLTEF